MRKTGKEILFDTVTDDERHVWLAEAKLEELYEFLRWAAAKESWALHGRDALNIVLAKENIKLQKDIRDMTGKMKRMTAWVIGLTVVITFLTFIQAYPIIKTFVNCTKTSVNNQKPENTTNQTTKPNQIYEKDKKK